MVPQGIADLPPLAEEGSVKLRAGHPPAKAVGLIGCRRQGGDLITKQAPFSPFWGRKTAPFCAFLYLSGRPTMLYGHGGSHRRPRPAGRRMGRCAAVRPGRGGDQLGQAAGGQPQYPQPGSQLQQGDGPHSPVPRRCKHSENHRHQCHLADEFHHFPQHIRILRFGGRGRGGCAPSAAAAAVFYHFKQHFVVLT